MSVLDFALRGGVPIVQASGAVRQGTAVAPRVKARFQPHVFTVDVERVGTASVAILR